MEDFLKIYKYLDHDTILRFQVGTCETMIFSPMLVFTCFFDYTNFEALLNYVESSIKVKLHS